MDTEMVVPDNSTEKPPPWRLYHTSYAEMGDFEHVSEDREISCEDIAVSIRKFEQISQQHSFSEDKPHAHDEDLGMSTEVDDGERNPLSYSFDDLSNDNGEVSIEEERSKSDGEAEEVQARREEDSGSVIGEEERSKSDGELDEDDDDAVPLKIQAVAMNKGTKLLLSNSWLKTVPSDVWDLTQLTELDLGANYLKKLSKSIANLTSLKKLRLNHNQLSVLPKEIWGLTRLTVLLLNNNCIKSIPKDIKNLTKLKTLDLSSNQITEISPKDGGLISLTSLIELRMRGNLITSVPPAMAETFTQLQVLWLDNNPITSIPKSIIKKPAQVILSYIKDHPNASKKGGTEVVKPRTRSSPPVLPGMPAVPHGKKDMHVIAEKELKKRKREQLEEMKKHIEVEKKVKLLEHELMLANAKALKFEEEAKKIEVASPAQTSAFPPHVPRQQGVVNKDKQLVESATSNSFEWEIPVAEVTFGPRIGRGGYGEVFRGMWRGTEVAAKMLFTDNMSAKLISDLRNEVELLCKLRHPNIVLFMGACTEPETPCIVTEYLGRGCLANILLDQSIEMDWGLRLQIGIDCARGMAYLHSRNPVIIHRDLKTDNLLVDDNWQVKVADFGLATVKSRTFAKTMCGTTGWVAPEVLAEEGYTEKADVYSFAIILWEMLTRQVPYAGKNTMQVVRSVDRGERLAIPDTSPPEYSALIHDCWASDPQQRPSFVMVLQRLEKMRANWLKEKSNTTATTTTALNGSQPTNNAPNNQPNGNGVVVNGVGAGNNNNVNNTTTAAIAAAAATTTTAADANNNNSRNNSNDSNDSNSSKTDKSNNNNNKNNNSVHEVKDYNT